MQVGDEEESGGPEAEGPRHPLPADAGGNDDDDADDNDDDDGGDDVDPDSTTWYASTTGGESEKSLARKLGYPPGWHVVRVVPHPADAVINGTEEGTAEARDGDGEEKPPAGEDAKTEMPTKKRVRGKSCMDVIHAGPPENCPDAYYNHSAALKAASEFPTDGTGTGYERNGGQMLPRVALFDRGDWVEVLYDEGDDGDGGKEAKEDDDGKKWYRAQVEKVKHYTNDIRYTVNYVDEDATQVVSEELLRKAPPPAPKKKKKKKTTKDSVKEAKAKAKAKAAAKVPTPKQTTKKKVPHAPKLTKKELRERQKLAKTMGLPEFWLASKTDHYKYDIISPGGDRFRTKKAAYAFLGWDEGGNEKHGGVDTDTDDEAASDQPSKNESKKRKKTEEGEGRKKKKRKKDSSGVDDAASASDETEGVAEQVEETQPIVEEEEEGDPPWRRTGHEYVGRAVRYAPRSDEGGGEEHVQIGRVTGWLDATDVDSNGEAAFLSEKDGKPAMLFHVSFKGEGVHKPGELLFQDFEDFELVEWLMPEAKT